MNFSREKLAKTQTRELCFKCPLACFPTVLVFVLRQQVYHKKKHKRKAYIENYQ